MMKLKSRDRSVTVEREMPIFSAALVGLGIDEVTFDRNDFERLMRLSAEDLHSYILSLGTRFPAPALYAQGLEGAKGNEKELNDD